MPESSSVRMSSGPCKDQCLVTNDLRSLLCGVTEAPLECRGGSVRVEKQNLEAQANRPHSWLLSLSTLRCQLSLSFCSEPCHTLSFACSFGECSGSTIDYLSSHCSSFVGKGKISAKKLHFSAPLAITSKL